MSNVLSKLGRFSFKGREEEKIQEDVKMVQWVSCSSTRPEFKYSCKKLEGLCAPVTPELWGSIPEHATSLAPGSERDVVSRK